MKHFGISEPCSENWNNMSPNEKGAFCSKCAKNVIDFTQLDPKAFKSELLLHLDGPICGRITKTQEDNLNAEIALFASSRHTQLQSAFLFSLLIIFGLSLFSCKSNESSTQIQQVQQAAKMHFSSEEVNKAVKENNKLILMEPQVLDFESEEVILGALSRVETDFLFEQIVEEPVLIKAHKTYDLDEYTGGVSWTRTAKDYLTQESITDTIYDENGIAIPKEFNARVYPNPLISEGNLSLELPTTSNLTIAVYDLNGKFIQTIHEGELRAGTRAVSFDLLSVPSGMYLVVIKSKEYKKTVRFIKN